MPTFQWIEIIPVQHKCILPSVITANDYCDSAFAKQFKSTRRVCTVTVDAKPEMSVLVGSDH